MFLKQICKKKKLLSASKMSPEGPSSTTTQTNGQMDVPASQILASNDPLKEVEKQVDQEKMKEDLSSKVNLLTEEVASLNSTIDNQSRELSEMKKSLLEEQQKLKQYQEEMESTRNQHNLAMKKLNYESEQAQLEIDKQKTKAEQTSALNEQLEMQLNEAKKGLQLFTLQSEENLSQISKLEKEIVRIQQEAKLSEDNIKEYEAKSKGQYLFCSHWFPLFKIAHNNN